jgi:hypothetical protein
MNRRKLLLGASIGVLVAALEWPREAHATPTTINYTVAYTGADFTSYITATNSMGTNFPASSSGNVTLAGATSTTVPLALTETADFTGHPITISGVTGTYLITSYNNTTKVATISALAGYPATFATTPGTGASYTIADIAVVITIGAAAAYTAPPVLMPGSNGNCWEQGTSNWEISGVTFDSAHTLTINGNTPWNPQAALRPNYTGDLTQPVLITSTNYGGAANDILQLNISGSGNFIFLNNIQFQVLNANQQGRGAIFDFTFQYTVKVTATNCLFQITNTAYGLFVCGVNTMTNCILMMDNATAGLVGGTGETYNNCAIFGYSQTGIATPTTEALGGGTFNGCWIFGTAALTNGTATTCTKCFSDSSGTGVTVVTPATQIASLNGQYYSDMRPISTTSMSGQSGAPPASTDIYGVTRTSGNWTAGPVQTTYALPSTQAIAYNVEASGGDITALTNPSILDNTTGPDLTYFQSGQVCSGTAADSSHIVLATTASASVVGHPVQWKTGVIGLITAFNASTHVATISAIAGYPANFGGTPQSGDAYTIFPTQVTFIIGYPASGNTWLLAQIYNPTPGSTGALVVTGLSSPTSHVRVTSNYTFNKSAVMGDITSQAVPCIANQFDHASIYGIGTPYFYTDHMQYWIYYQPPNTAQEGEGLYRFGAEPGASGTPGVAPFVVGTTKCLMRNDNHSSVGAHQFFMQDTASYADGSVFFDTCILDSTCWYETVGNLQFTAIDCTIMCNYNLVLTATGATTSGGNTITVASTAQIETSLGGSAGPPLGSLYSLWPCHGSITVGTSVTVTNATTLTLSAPTTGAINIGDKIYFGVQAMISWGAGGSLENTAILGSSCPVYAAGASSVIPAFTTCATDVPVTGTTGPGQTTNLSGAGFTQVNFATLFNAGSGVGSTGIDLRLAAGGSQLAGSGTHRSSNPTDIFEQTRANPPTIGAQEFGVASTAGNLMMGIPVP